MENDLLPLYTLHILKKCRLFVDPGKSRFINRIFRIFGQTPKRGLTRIKMGIDLPLYMLVACKV